MVIMGNSKPISFVQINAGRAMKTNAEIRQLVDIKGVQVVAIQEPYTVKGKVASFGSTARVISGEKKGEAAWAAVVVFDLKVVVMRLDQMSDIHMVCAQIDDGKTKLYIISGYFQYSHSRKTYLDKLDRIVKHLHGHRVLICIDANARSPMWHADELTEEGEELESLIAELNLYIVNEANQAKTYSRPGGEGNIYVTLATESIIRRTGNWKVREGWVSSDHRAITFEVAHETRQTVNQDETPSAKFMTKKADWEAFDKAFARKMSNSGKPENKVETIQLARKLRRALVESCKESMPVKGKPKACAKWWSKELTEIKVQVHGLRRKFQKAKKLNRNHGEVESTRREYHNLRSKYDRELFTARTKSWKEFITESSKNPWGYAYKLTRDKIRGQQAINSIRTSSGFTTDWRESAEVLLDSLFSYDEPMEDTVEQEWMRSEIIEDFEGDDDDEPVKEKEIENQLYVI